MKKIGVVLFVLFFVVCTFAGLKIFIDLFQPTGSSNESVIFEVKPGEPLGVVANRLQELGLITDSRSLRLYARFTGQADEVRVGEYEVQPSMAPVGILSLLTSGKSILHKVTFQEGLNMHEIADILQERSLANKGEFLNLCQDQEFIHALLGERLPSLEGYLFPETYQFTKYTGARGIIRAMVERFLTVYQNHIPENLKFKLNRHEIVILASMIEKETGAPHERPRISSVFHNRLKKGMRLQSDPTIIYGVLMKTGRMLENIKKKHILEKTKYNTYTVNGLPYGPIANPGKESLLAVITPEDTDYLYFVSQNDGTHYFSKTYEEHLQAVRDYQLNRKAREGKSWRDLSRNKSKEANN